MDPTTSFKGLRCWEVEALAYRSQLSDLTSQQIGREQLNKAPPSIRACFRRPACGRCPHTIPTVGTVSYPR